MMKKRGFITIQFHWIFVLIAGGFILFLFLIFINSGQEAFEKKTSTELVVHFDTLFSTFSTDSGDTEHEYPSKESIVIQSQCQVVNDGSYISDFSIAGSGIDKSTGHIILYSLDEIKGKSIYTRTLSVSLPFTMGSFVYMTDPNVNYVFYDAGESELAKMRSLQGLLPEGASSQYISDLTRIKTSGYDVVVIVSLSSPPPYSELEQKVDGTKKTEFRFVQIEPLESAIEEAGSVHFYLKEAKKATWENDGLDVGYVGKEMLLGAVFSADYEMYRCNAIKINQQIGYITEVLSERSSLLKETGELSTICNTYMDDSVILLGRFEDGVKGGIIVPQYIDPIIMPEFIQNVTNMNEQLILRSCPVLY